MRRPEIEGFIAAAPPANMFDFTFLAPCPSSGMIIQGSQDDLVPEPQVAALADRLGNQRDITIDYNVIDGANHFFQERLDSLTAHVEGYLDQRLDRSATVA